MNLQQLVRLALEEDIGHGDVTSASTVPESARCTARIVAKSDGLLSGIEVFQAVFTALGISLDDWEGLEDGDSFVTGAELARFSGPARAVLCGERVALNFLQHLTGVATATAALVRAVEGTGAAICDTRKTTPLHRNLEKQAVRHGGGRNHRHSLDDGILIKENHIAAAGGIGAAVEQARLGAHHLLRVEVEVENLAEFDKAMAAGADAVLLDNMTPADMRAAVERRGDRNIVLEASGNVTLDTVRAIAETGVDLISVGGITHSAPAADLSLLIELVD